MLFRLVSSYKQTIYHVHELPGPSTSESNSSDNQLISLALLTHIEFLEAEKRQTESKKKEKQDFRIEDIRHDDKLIRFYTGFFSYAVFLTFFEQLGPVVNHLTFWGSLEIQMDGVHLKDHKLLHQEMLRGTNILS